MLDVASVKRQLRDVGDDEEILLESYVAAAIAHIEQHCDRRIVEGVPADSSEMSWTKDVEQAALLLVAHWYANREAVVVGVTAATVPLGFESLLWYRKRF
ncbi:hypothetical protein GCM10007242_16550 [Pigmentiphaga litoralis]|uniref:head-tail connector protein n=1 Tax=Pigmentiphaga litoralis TaxID=516702 RepID=UPI001676223D|nr:head-tail connector protein [Pigmentiphaga litoralis]GGX11173.1 hypothetical protein GCM10007242_16550 [Pigmentiphaga litoralis]